MEMKSLIEIEEEVNTCVRCPLYRTRKQPVIGSYPVKKNGILFIAESPNKIEDMIGLPLLGSQGRLFTETMQKTLNLSRKDYNVIYCVKCFPNLSGKKVEPKQDSIFWCAEYLYEQIHLLKPSLIVTLGRIPFFVLLRKKDYNFTTRRKIALGEYLGHLYKAKSILYTEEYYTIPLSDPFKWLKNKELLKKSEDHLLKIGRYLHEIKSGKNMEDILLNSPTIS